MNRADENSIDRMKAADERACPFIDLVAIGFSRNADDVGMAELAARKLLTKYGGVRGFGEASPSEWASLGGLEEFELLRARALIEIGRRIALAKKGSSQPVDTPEYVVKLLEGMRGEKREHFFAVLLDSKSKVIRIAEVHVGTLTMSVVGAREVFREAIRDGASSVVIAHNHPSGDPDPSPEDIEVTRTLVKIGEMLDIPVLDHVIIGEDRWCSLKRLNFM